MRRSLGPEIEHINLSKVGAREKTKQILVSCLDKSESNQTCGNEGRKQVSDLFSVAASSAKNGGESVSGHTVQSSCSLAEIGFTKKEEESCGELWK